jgi:hypothetical protein
MHSYLIISSTQQQQQQSAKQKSTHRALDKAFSHCNKTTMNQKHRPPPPPPPPRKQTHSPGKVGWRNGAVLLVLYLAFSFLGETKYLKSLLESTEFESELPGFAQIKSKDEDESVHVFYNLYLKKNGDYQRVQKLANSQLALMLPQHTAHVISIGSGINSSSFFDTTDVVHVAQYESGGEQLTLRALWDYCGNNTSSKVVYLHSKGSFHPSRPNDKLRKYLTRGALSEECLNLPDTCDVCASRMSPLPHP